MRSSVIGLDIGGANLKWASPDGIAGSRPFALWRQPDGLAAALGELLRDAPAHERIAVTMTGELCDCFTTKREGVAHILDAVEEVANGKPLHVWTTDGTFLDGRRARHAWLQVAAANWLATATWAGRFAPQGAALLLDAGSTTTDLVPLWEGRPMPFGLTDPDRLKTGELVYTGARRTPVCALLNGEGAAELFATMLDVHLLLGHRSEDANDLDTADGRPATRPFAHARMARMLGGDGELIPTADTLDLAQRAAARQAEIINAAARMVAARLPERPAVLLTAGSGEFLASAVTDPPHGWPDICPFSLARELGPAVSAAACAYAVAVLAEERVG